MDKEKPRIKESGGAGLPQESLGSSDKDLKTIQEQAAATLLTPSMLDRYFNYIFGKYTGESIPEIFKHYIEPLKSDTAKEAVKILLLASEMHPESLRELGDAEIKSNIVRVAEEVAAELKDSGLNPTPEAILSHLRPKLNELRDRIREKKRDEKLVELQRKAESLGDDEEITESESFQEDTDSSTKDEAVISYFPGMPLFTHRLKTIGRVNPILVKQNKESHRTNIDEEVYEVYFGRENVGRFTIRRHGSVVERNLFLTYPTTGEIVSIGKGGSVFDDYARQASEYGGIIVDKIKQLLGR